VEKEKWRTLPVGEVHDPGRRPPEERAMDKRIRKPAAAHELERISLGELFHQHV